MKFYKIIGIISIVVFSFYLTDFATELAINSKPLMQTIKDSSDNYQVSSVNATIKDNTIIPGIKGKKVNTMESFLNMKDFGSFNINYLVYDSVVPSITLEQNKDKVIISGNKKIRQISLLVKDNNEIKEYLNKNNIDYSYLINYLNEFDKENINIESNKNKFLDLDTLLRKKDLNKKICILDYSNIEICKNKKYYIVKPSITLKNSNVVSSINMVEKGSIILIDNNLSLDNFKIFLKSIKSKDLKIVYLSEIIKE